MVEAMCWRLCASDRTLRNGAKQVRKGARQVRNRAEVGEPEWGFSGGTRTSVLHSCCWFRLSACDQRRARDGPERRRSSGHTLAETMELNISLATERYR